MVALLRGGAWIEIPLELASNSFSAASHSFAGVRGLKYTVQIDPYRPSPSHSFAGVRGLKYIPDNGCVKYTLSHSFAGVRGLKYLATIYIIWYLFVALLSGGAWS